MSAEHQQDMGATSVADATANAVLEIGRTWMGAKSTGARNRDAGFESPFGLWVNGRAGVMGDVTAAVAAAAIGFMAPARVAEIWGQRPAELSPADCATLYAEAAAEWGHSTLGMLDADRLQRLTRLAMTVAEAADSSLGALFAGWREIPLPSDPAGAATVALQILRELRGGAHLAAVNAVGIGPLGAIMSVDNPIRGGTAGAERFGWPEPHPGPDPARRAEAEVLTTRAVAPAYGALSSIEGAELTELVLAARATFD